ncbi:MAG TPA: MEDS domain-containing protein [Candidatus Angelobacter sp.]|nr:MEDS domain-containing protein [Candidatus Angelobacter sp.]
MSTSQIAGNPRHSSAIGPCGHAVQFYETDLSLIESVVQHFASPLSAGDTTVIVATPEHCQALAETLAKRGIEVAVLRANNRYIEMDAAGALEKIMLQGLPDPERFASIIGARIVRAEALAQGRRVLVYGEMVALLWQEARYEATIRLEQLWNSFAERHSFFLLCGYPLELFNHAENRRMFFNICGEHTSVNAAKSYGNTELEGGRKCKLDPLQRQTGALENEIRLSQARTLMLQSATKGGAWELDIDTDTFSFSSAAAKLLNLHTGILPLSAFLGHMYYSGDRDAISSSLEQAQRSRRSFTAGFRIRNGESTRLLEIRGKTFYNAGSPIMLGVLLDVTPSAGES